MFEQPINVLIVDDEEEARHLLANLLAEIDFVEVLGTAADADQALTMIIKHEPDLVFLDIEMPEKDAFALLKEVKTIGMKVDVIMVTGYKRYALDAIKEHVVDYLVKPVDRLDLLRSLVTYNKLKNGSATAPANNKIKIPTRTGIIYLDSNNVVYCQAESNYTRIHLVTGQSELCSNTLGRMEELCNKNFIRISRSYMINTDFLYRVDRKNKQCILLTGKNEIVLTIPAKNIKLLL